LKPASPILLRDWKAALDCTVIKKGVFSFVFHPYGWSTPEQLVDFIDYAQTKYGMRVKFLTFKEAEERLNKNVLGGRSLRNPKTGTIDGVYLYGSTGSEYFDVTIDNKTLRIFDAENKKWTSIQVPQEGVGDPRYPRVRIRLQQDPNEYDAVF